MVNLYPTSDLVAVSLIKNLPGINSNQVATTLPVNASTWSGAGFVQVYTVGGTPNQDIPVGQPVLTVDVWANTPNSANPPFGKANQLAEIIRAGLQNTSNFHGKQVTTPNGYYPAIVIGAWLVQEPRRVDGDPNSYARYTFDIQINWAIYS